MELGRALPLNVKHALKLDLLVLDRENAHANNWVAHPANNAKMEFVKQSQIHAILR